MFEVNISVENDDYFLHFTFSRFYVPGKVIPLREDRLSN